jgi:Kef-type K+ transport system membrane component KefB
MEEAAKIFITLGCFLLMGLVTDMISRRIRLPRVTLLLIFGFAIGPAGLHIFSPEDGKWFPVITNMALVMIGFLLGERFTLSSLREHGRLVLWLSISEVVGTALVVLAGLLFIGFKIQMALLLAGISTATDPAATIDVVNETNADGTFTRTLLGVVAVDDAWGLIVFSLLLTSSHIITGQEQSTAPLIIGAWELGGALFVGIALGVPMAYLTGRIRPGEPTLVEALGGVFLCGGIAMWLGVSFLLASMVLGTVVANLARHHARPFHAIEGIDWPFMILFFLIAGASLEISSLEKIGLFALAYIIFRAMGRFMGGWLGGVLGSNDPVFRRCAGMALMPQAGVALGMALVAVERCPDFGEIILAVVIASTVLFEIAGPVLTRLGLIYSGDVRQRQR